MKVTIKAYLFTIGVFLILIALIICRYEKLLTSVRTENVARVEGGSHDKRYTASEIIALIKASKEYLGDSVTVFDDGQIRTGNGQFQGTINAVTGSTANMDVVRSNMGTNNLPIQYNIYLLAAQYYRQQYHIPPTAKPN